MRCFLAMLFLATSPIVAQQDARSILAMAAEKQAAREANVENYTLIQTVSGMQAPVYYEKETLGGAELFRLVPISEWQRRRPGAPQSVAPMANGMARGLDMLAGPMAQKMGEVPGGAMMSGYMSNMMSDMSTFLRAAEQAEAMENDGRADAVEHRNGLAQFAARAKLVGTDSVASGRAFHLVAENLADLPIEQPGDGTTMSMVDAHMWIDAVEYVPVRLLMHAIMERDGQNVPLTIEMQQLDYESFGPLHVSTRQVMRIEGLMEAFSVDSKQRKELEMARREAEKMRAQMAEMDEQLAGMPASARRMVQGQIDKAMAQLDMLVNNGTLASEVETTVLAINEGPPFDWVPLAGRVRQ